MKLTTLSIAAILSLSALPLTATISYADDCRSARDAVSYIEIPGKKCFDLTYLTVVGGSRDDMSQANRIYRQALDLNATGSTTYTTTYSDRYRYTSKSVTDHESSDERQAKREFLNQATNYRDKTALSHEAVESAAFRIHTNVMTQLSGVLVTPSPSR